MPKQVRTRSLVAAFLLAWWCAEPLVAQVPADRVLGSIDENKVTTLLGNVHPMAKAEFDRGGVAPEMPIEHLVLQLQPSEEQQSELDALVEAQHNPQSALYHQWLTPAEYGARFGASQQDVARIAGWLTQHGFVVEEVAANHRQIIFSGNVGQIEDTFHSPMHRYVIDGISHIANTDDPQIPSALGAVVSGIVSLHDFRRASGIGSRMAVTLQPRYTSGSAHYLYPADWATIYDVNPLYKAGTSGAGVSIAIVGRSNIKLTDIAEFRQSSALPANNPTVILVNMDPGMVAGDQDESTLDVEWSGAIAPAAAVKFVVAASGATTDGIDLSAQYVVNHATAQVVSTSYGSCEQDMGATELSFYNSLWQQAASEGMSSFVSSGDAGAAGCYAGSASSASSPGVNGLCSSPYATCVGGTEFHEGSTAYWSANNGSDNGSALGYIPEEVWNESGVAGGSGLWASGGGASLRYAQPTWQKGISGAAAANGMRAVPDVAMTAAGHDGYIIVENGSFFEIAGTSAASPSLAGLMALIVEANHGAGQGNANPSLYGLANASKNPFHATPSGNNSVPGQPGFAATGAPFNLATGLGSVDAAVLASEWGGGSKTAMDFVLTASPSSGTVVAGRTTTFTLQATESGTGSDRITLTATASSGISGSISPASILPGTPATVMVTAAAASAAGAKTVSITGTDSTGTEALTYTLTVMPLPTLTLHTPSSSTALVQGTSVTVAFEAVTGGSFSGNLGYAVSGLPAGVTAKWSANPQTPAASASSNNQVLTLTASAVAAPAAATVTVTVAGDGLSVSQPLNLQVQAAPGVVMTVTPGSLLLTSAANVTTTVTLTPQGGLVAASGAAGSSISVASALPKNVKAAWSGPVLTSTGAITWKLTLNASSGAVASTSTLSLDAVFAGKAGNILRADGFLPVTVALSSTQRLLPKPVHGPIHGAGAGNAQ